MVSGSVPKVPPRMDASGSGQYINVTYPKYLSVIPGTTLQDFIEANLKKDPASQAREICKIALEEFTHDDSSLSKLGWPTSSEDIAANKKSGNLGLNFSPTTEYIDSKICRRIMIFVSAYLPNPLKSVRASFQTAFP